MARSKRLTMCAKRESARSKCPLLTLSIAIFLLAISSLAAETPPQRIVSLSPNITEILFALGLEEQIAGVTDFCKYPPEAQKKAKVGKLLSPNIEVIISLKPELVIMLPSYEKTRKKLVSLGIEMLEVKNDTIADVLESITVIGTATQRKSEAKNLVKEMKSDLDRIAKEVENLPRVRVLFVADHNPGTLQQIYAAAPGTIIDEMITAAGGQNVLKRSLGKYPIVSKEEIIALDPEVIVDASFSDAGTQKSKHETDRLSIWKQLPSVSAVKNGRVIAIDDPILTIPGIRIPKNINYFKQVFHPKAGSRVKAGRGKLLLNRALFIDF